jgi:hypothetical protein
MKPSFFLILLALNVGIVALVNEVSQEQLLDAIIALVIIDFIIYVIYQYKHSQKIGCGTWFIIIVAFLTMCGNSLNEDDVSTLGNIVFGIAIIALLTRIFYKPSKNSSKKELDRIIELAHQQEIIENQQEKEEAERPLNPPKRAKNQRDNDDEDTEEFLRKETERIDKILKMRDTEVSYDYKNQIPEVKESAVLRCVGVCSDCNRTECLNDKLREERRNQRKKDEEWMKYKY